MQAPTMRDRKKPIAFPIQLYGEGSAFAELPTEIHVVPTGRWSHPVYGEMEITSEHITEFKRNFDSGVRRDLPITQGHDNGMSGGELPAVAWFKELHDRGVAGLYATVEWTDEGKELLKNRSFKYLSPEFYEVYEDPETQEKYYHVLVGAALTNKPYFKELDPVVTFSEPLITHQFTEDTMDLKTILAKKPEELSAEEKAFVVEHKSELSSEESTAFASVLGDAGETPEEKVAREEKEAGDANEANGLNRDGSPKEPVTASEKGFVKISAAEHAILTKKANEGALALQKIEASERTAMVAKMTFSDTNKEGHFSVAQAGALEGFIKTLSETQKSQFVNLINKMPKADASLFTETGDAGSSVAKAVFAEVQAEAKKLMDANKALKYSEAVKQVMRANPDLEKRYNESVSAGEAGE